jgi:hypothetical protein
LVATTTKWLVQVLVNASNAKWAGIQMKLEKQTSDPAKNVLVVSTVVRMDWPCAKFASLAKRIARINKHVQTAVQVSTVMNLDPSSIQLNANLASLGCRR